MGGMKVSELEFLRLLPAFMRDDEAAIALSKAMNRLIGEPSKRLKTLRVAVGATIAEKAAAAARLFCGAYGFIKCGTRGTGTKGAVITNKAATAAGLTCAAYSFVRCGTRRCGE